MQSYSSTHPSFIFFHARNEIFLRCLDVTEKLKNTHTHTHTLKKEHWDRVEERGCRNRGNDSKLKRMGNDVRHGVSLEFLWWIYSWRKRVHARVSASSNKWNTSTLRLRVFPSRTDRFTLAVNHITSWNIFSRLELNLGCAWCIASPAIHRRSKSPNVVVETFAFRECWIPFLYTYHRWKLGMSYITQSASVFVYIYICTSVMDYSVETINFYHDF